MQPMQGPPMMPPPPPPAWRAAPGPPPSTDGKAVVALVLGILSLLGAFCWLGLPFGIPAVVLGALAHRDIRRSDGMTGGGGLATAGIVTGSLGSLTFLGYAAVMVAAIVSSSRAASTPVPLAPAAAATATATAATTVPPGGWGNIHVVELHPSSSTPLRAQLAGEVTAAKGAGETVLVETTTRTCAACREIALAMREPPLQSALASARLVRLDVDELAAEATPMGLRERALPWFYLLDAHGDPRDAISADEWDDNEAEQIAPVLDAFVHGKLRARRKAWRGTSL